MKKIPLILLLSVALLSTLACGLFSALTGSNNDTNSDENASSGSEVIVMTATPNTGNDNGILFQDDFSDPNSGWDRNDWDNGFTDYVDGAYQVTVKVENFDVWANPSRDFERDVSVEVDATKVGGDLDDNYGIQCRYSGPSDSPSFYFFYISSDGYAVIGKVIDGSITYLSSEQMEYTEAINQGYSTNHLRADCIGTNLAFYVNGTLVATTSDSSLSSGDIGLDGGTFSIPTATFLFDNILVTRP